MYKRFKVSNFRCFQQLTVSNLERVNLIAGVNNVGKTALLEALFLHCGAYNPALALKLTAFRGFESVRLELARRAETPWDSLFGEFDTSRNVEFIAENDVTGKRMLRLKVVHQPEELANIGKFMQQVSEKHPSTIPSSSAIQAFGLERETAPTSSEVAQVLELEYEEAGKHGKYHLILDSKGMRAEPIPPAPPFPAFFQGSRLRIPFREDVERFGKLQVRGEEDVLLKVLKLIEPRLTRLAPVVEAGEPTLQGDIGITGRRLVPLPVMGEGMVRLTSLVLQIANAPHGVVLVDEIENGLHHSVLSKVWRAIAEVARRFNTQFFATTHSLECIVAAHRAFTESDIYDFRLHRLERTKETIRAVTYDQEALAAAIGASLEVR